MAVQDYAPTLLGIMWTQVFLAILFIGLRMYSRYFLIRSVGLDDMMMMMNLLFFISYVLLTTLGIAHGIGKKHASVSPVSYSQAIMWEVIAQGVCILGIAASKGCVVIFLLRIVIQTWHIALLWFCLVSTTALCVITTTLLFLQCRPTRFLWDESVGGEACWLDFTTVGLSMGAWSAAMDLVLAILPWHIVMGLNMKRKEKLTVGFGLSLGIFAGICSGIRTYELQALSSLDEYVYDTVPMLLWSSTEVLATIICACIPVLRPLYVRMRHGSEDSSSGRLHSYPLNERANSNFKAGTRGRESPSGVSSNGGDAGKGGSRATDEERIYAGLRARVLETMAKMGGESASEESILREINGEQGHRKGHLSGELIRGYDAELGIMRTDEIRVTSSYKEDSMV